MPSFTEIVYNPYKDHPRRSRMWMVRDTLYRLKIRDKVINFNPFDCGDDCKECFPQFFPATVRVSNAVAQQSILALTEAIQENTASLRSSLAAHADFVVTRWRKKSREKRLAFMEEHSSHYPKNEDEHVYYTGPNSQALFFNTQIEQVSRVQRVPHPRDPEGVVNRFRDTWFLPYLDAEMLSEDPLLLLGLLHHRTVNEPEKWISFDSSHVVLAECFGPVDHVFNSQCVLVQGPDYGKLVNWNARQMHRGEIMGFTKAYFVLTAQSRMMALLRRFVSGLLAESNEAPIYELHPKWSQLVQTDFSRFGTTSAWSTDSVKPFSAPPSFDPHAVVEIVASRHRAARDEIELLQADPAYVQFRARELASAHFFETFSGSDRWPYFVDQLFLVPLQREMFWRQLNGESKRMGVWLKAVEECPSDTEARAEYEYFVSIVWDLCLESFAVFESGVEGSLLYQRGFEKNLNIQGDGKSNKHDRKFSKYDYFPDDMLYWAVSSLGYDAYRPLSMDPSLNFAIIDHMCRTDRKQAARISQSLLVQLSDMAVLFEVMNSIKSRPIRECRLTHENANKLLKEECRDQFIKKINPPFADKEIGDKLGESLERACTQSTWPRGRKNQEWLDEATASQEALDVFWSEMRTIWAHKLRKEGGVAGSYIKEDIDGLMRFSHSEKHLTELAAQREHVLRQLARREKRTVDAELVLQTVWGGDSNNSSTSPQTPVARKTRTRSSRSVSKDNIATLPAPVEPAITLSRPSRIANGEDSSRSFAWQHFLAAMTDAGFSILQSQGSAVTLKLGKSQGVDTIVVHRPHPVATINPIMLRSIAKRMSKWFGWGKKTFAELEKEQGLVDRSVAA
ncbi:hypothetical protein D6D01_02497 [Aureobasidium pullulans]|uniref:Uncharacterized protein n=1 Tax=Aureobasidium pullulans TaxID=5580 RepID=A0A4S9LS69_AURPU|nr:hypothetical protein D6D01_02497 [Aureobasidium pullulans]